MLIREYKRHTLQSDLFCAATAGLAVRSQLEQTKSLGPEGRSWNSAPPGTPSRSLEKCFQATPSWSWWLSVKSVQRCHRGKRWTYRYIIPHVLLSSLMSSTWILKNQKRKCVRRVHPFDLLFMSLSFGKWGEMTKGISIGHMKKRARREKQGCRPVWTEKRGQNDLENNNVKTCGKSEFG